jgi:hypothetical protein
MKKYLFYFCIPFVFLFSVNNVFAGDAVFYTSINEADCRRPESVFIDIFDKSGVSAQKCAGVSGVSVFAVSSDANSWLEFLFEGKIFSSEDFVVYREPVRAFPNLGGDKIEWHISKDGRPSAMIFRISSQSKNNANKKIKELLVFRFVGGFVYYCGAARDNLSARALLSSNDGCHEKLKSVSFP